MDEAWNAIQQQIAANNAWSAQQADRQMSFQREMSNTAFQRQVADLKAAGLNPVLAAKLGGASTPTGAMGGTDTSGTAALVQLLEMSMETASAAAGAARAAANANEKAVTPPEDNAAENLGEIFTTADAFGMKQDEDGNYYWDNKHVKKVEQKVNSVLDLVPGGSLLKKWFRAGLNIIPDALNALDEKYTFSAERADQLEANRRRLQADYNASVNTRTFPGGKGARR